MLLSYFYTAGAMNKIDYDLISEFEGGRRTVGYVPAADMSNSGVTIGTGVDLGQRNEADLVALNLSNPLRDKLSPYLQKKRDEALEAIKRAPLVISGEEAAELDKAVKGKFVETLRYKYMSCIHNASSRDLYLLPTEAQTVIASVAFQYGVNLDIRTPRFWKAVCQQDWPLAAEILRDFGDAYPTRRKREAKLLERLQ